MKYLCTCMECEYQWETNEEYNIQSYCPRCMQGDIKQELNTEYASQNDFNRANLNEKDEIV